MAYIGNPPADRYSAVSYQDLTGGTGTSFTLDYAVGSANEIEVFVNNVRQEPSVAYTVSGTALTMTGSIASTDDFYVVFQGKAQQTVTHPATHALTATDGTFTGDLQVDGSTTTLDSQVFVGGNITVGTNNSLTGSEGGQITFRNDDATASAFFIDVSGVNNRLFTTTNNQDVLIGQLSGTGGKIKFYTGATERMRVTDNGITFNGDTAAANALDDYEEGTWTPTDESGAGLTFYAVYSASYTKIGDTVYVSAYFQYPSTTNTSNTAVGGLPYTAENTSNLYHSLSLGYKSSTNPSAGLITPNTSLFDFRSESGAILGNDDMSSVAVIISGVYKV